MNTTPVTPPTLSNVTHNYNNYDSNNNKLNQQQQQQTAKSNDIITNNGNATTEYKPTLNDIELATKYSKFVISALGYEDVPTAVKYLKLALKSLTNDDS